MFSSLGNNIILPLFPLSNKFGLAGALFKTFTIFWLLVYLAPSGFFYAMFLQSQISAINVVGKKLLLPIGTIAKTTKVRPKWIIF